VYSNNVHFTGQATYFQKVIFYPKAAMGQRRV